MSPVPLAYSAAQANFIVTCTVKSKPNAVGQVLVELDWVVRDGNGRVAGQVTQIHDLNLADITPYWSDVAATASKAASGIQQVVSNAVLKKMVKPATAPQG